MEITEVRISLRDDDKLKAFASITFDDSFVIRGLKIIEGGQGTFVAMPSRRRNDGTYQDVAHPVNNEMRCRCKASCSSASSCSCAAKGPAPHATITSTAGIRLATSPPVVPAVAASDSCKRCPPCVPESAVNECWLGSADNASFETCK